MAAGSDLLTPIRSLLQQPLPRSVDHRRMLIVAVVTSIALIINHYLAIQTSLGEGLQWFANLTDQSPAPWFRWLRQSS